MILFKPYSNIKDFLHRFTLLKIGNLHIRLHRISSEDKSTLFHNHPFHYISIVLKNGYTETFIKNGKVISKHNRFLSVIVRNRLIYHRIDKLHGETITLFIAYGNYGWKAFNTINDKSHDGLYERFINKKLIWAKRENGIWFIGHKDKIKASEEIRHSIHQIF